MAGIEAALALSRFVHFLGAMLTWGAAVFLVALAPRPIAGRLAGQLRPLGSWTIAATLIAILMQWPLTAADFGGDWPSAADPATLLAVLHTSPGRAWMWQASLALLLASAWMLLPKKWSAAAIAAALLLATSALAGHAAMTAGIPQILHQLNDAIHLLASGFWIGALVPLTAILGSRLAGADALTAVRRFAVAGQLAVAFTIGTGIINAWFITGGMPIGWSSPYDVMLDIKIAIVGLMLLFATINHFRFLPDMRAGGDSAARAIRRGAIAEIAAGASAIGLVAVFGMFDPA